jgi:5'-3' exonuclease
MREIKGLDLIIDCNYILYRSVYSLIKTQTLFGDLEKSLEVSFDNYFHKYPFRKIYMVSDSKSSWRKRIYAEYKADRKEKRDTQEEVDWDFVFNTYEQFKSKVSNKRVTIVEGGNIEGDDYINFLINKSNSDGYSVLYVSSDKDLNQKLDFRLNPSWMNIQWYDNYKNGKIYLPKGYKLLLQELNEYEPDLFSSNNNTDFLNIIKDLCDKNAVEEIDKEQSLFVKILSGDDGDNIESVLKVPTKTNPDKFMGIGNAGALKIWDKFKSDYPEEIDFVDDKWLKNVMYYILDYKKLLDKKSDYEEILEKNLVLNRKLIHLHEKYLPDDINEKIKLVK